MKHFKEVYLLDRNYRINLWIFRIVALLTLSLLIYIWQWDSFSGRTHFYSYCSTSEKGGCFNGFYNSMQYCGSDIPANDSLCTVEHMYPGQSLGEKPPWFITYLWWMVMGLFFLGLALNSLIFGFRDYKPPSSGIGGVI